MVEQGSGLTTIFLSVPDAELFLEFRRQQEVFYKLVSSGVFSIRGGSAILHFDDTGALRKIERRDMLLRS